MHRCDDARDVPGLRVPPHVVTYGELGHIAALRSPVYRPGAAVARGWSTRTVPPTWRDDTWDPRTASRRPLAMYEGRDGALTQCRVQAARPQASTTSTPRSRKRCNSSGSAESSVMRVVTSEISAIFARAARPIFEPSATTMV